MLGAGVFRKISKYTCNLERKVSYKLEDKQAAVVLKGLKKYFPGTKALDWKDEDTVEIYAGEIHGLVGENGAGKSTTFQILMGIYDMTEGEISLFGENYKPANVHEAEAAGVSIIMQQPNFAYNLTVAENIFMGHDNQFTNKMGLIDWKKQNEAAAEILKKCKYDNIKPTDVLSNLSYEETKQVEIARALSTNPRVLLVDETSAAISKKSVESLYSLLRELAANGCAVIYISHFIDEVYALCDRVSILRDGKLITKMKINEQVSSDVIIKNMVGRDVSLESYRSEDQSSIGDVMLELKDYSKKGSFDGIDLVVHSGEIIGLAGLGGCGSEALGKAIFGYEPADSGTMIYKNEKINPKSCLQAMRYGIGYIPKDREKEGLFLSYDSVMNISSANMKNMCKRGIINQKEERQVAIDSINRFLIKTPDESYPVSDMSGGNRQKVAISRWVVNDSDLLIVCSPTRGVDVGAKYEIYGILEELKNQGKGIILISDEMPELIGMSDRIYCMKNGVISGELDRSEVTEELLAIRMV